MLQLHSSKAWQVITYHCLNSVPWGNVTQNAIKLQGDDDFEFHNKMLPKLRPVVVEDNCQVGIAPHRCVTCVALSNHYRRRYCALFKPGSHLLLTSRRP